MDDHEVPIVDLMDVGPRGSKADEVGRDPANDDGRGFDHGSHPVVGTCVECGHVIHEGVVAHVCDGTLRDHADGEGIEPVGDGRGPVTRGEW